MGKTTRYVGMDVHAATIAVAVVEGRGFSCHLPSLELCDGLRLVAPELSN